MTSRSIKIEIRNVYGEDKAYPVCQDAEIFARLAGTKTLTRATLANVLALGYAIDVVDRYGNISKRFEPQRTAGAAPALPAVM